MYGIVTDHCIHYMGCECIAFISDQAIVRRTIGNDVSGPVMRLSRNKHLVSGSN